jgi:hypothetical protein
MHDLELEGDSSKTYLTSTLNQFQEIMSMIMLILENPTLNYQEPITSKERLSV